MLKRSPDITVITCIILLFSSQVDSWRRPTNLSKDRKIRIPSRNEENKQSLESRGFLGLEDIGTAFLSKAKRKLNKLKQSKKFSGNVIKPKKNSFIDVKSSKLDYLRNTLKRDEDDILGILTDKNEFIGKSLSRKKDLSTQFLKRDLIGLPLREKINEISTAFHKRKSSIGNFIQNQADRIKNGQFNLNFDKQSKIYASIGNSKKKLSISASIGGSISIQKPLKPVCEKGKSYCFLGYCTCKQIDLTFPICVFNDIISFGKVLLTLPLYCKWINPRHECCKILPTTPSLPAKPPITIAPTLPHICPQGICPTIAFNVTYPLCIVPSKVFWNSMEIDLRIFCLAFNPNHKCCENQGGNGIKPPITIGSAKRSPSVPTETICILGDCKSTRIILQQPKCELIDPPSFNGVPLSILKYCLLVNPSHACCGKIKGKFATPESSIQGVDSGSNGLCPLGFCAICPSGRCSKIPIRFPNCYIPYLLTWNGAPLNLEIFCQLFDSSHSCCQGENAKGSGVPALSMESQKITCLFGYCIPGGIKFKEDCSAIEDDPVMFGKIKLTMEMICKYIQSGHTCCGMVSKNIVVGGKCPFGICAEGGVEVQWPECALKGMAKWNGQKVTLALACLFWIRDHQCCKEPKMESRGNLGESGGVHELINGGNPICLKGTCVEDSGKFEVGTGCDGVKGDDKVGEEILTVDRICTEMNPGFRCCGGSGIGGNRVEPFRPRPRFTHQQQQLVKAHYKLNRNPAKSLIDQPTNTGIQLYNGVGKNSKAQKIRGRGFIRGIICGLFCSKPPRPPPPPPSSSSEEPDKCNEVGKMENFVFGWVSGYVFLFQLEDSTYLPHHRCCGGDCGGGGGGNGGDSGEIENIQISKVCLFGVCVEVKPGKFVISLQCILIQAPVIGAIKVNLKILCLFILPKHRCCRGILPEIDWNWEIGFGGEICIAGVCKPTGGIEITNQCVIINPPFFGNIRLTIPLLCKYGNKRHRCCNNNGGGGGGGIGGDGNWNICPFGICSLPPGGGIIIISNGCKITTTFWIGNLRLTLALFCIWVNPNHRCCANGGGGGSGGTGSTGTQICLFGHCHTIPLPGTSSLIEITPHCVIISSPKFGNLTLTLPIFCYFLNPSHRCCKDITLPPLFPPKPCPFGLCLLPPIPPIGSINIPSIITWPLCKFLKLFLWNGTPLTLDIFCSLFSPTHKCCTTPVPTPPGGGLICLFGICITNVIQIEFPACIILSPPFFGRIKLTLPLFCKFINPYHKCCNDGDDPPGIIVGPCPLGICPTNLKPPTYPKCRPTGHWNGIPITLPLYCLLFQPSHKCCNGDVGGPVTLKPPTPRPPRPPRPPPPTPKPPIIPPTNCATQVCIQGICAHLCIQISLKCVITVSGGLQIGPFKLTLEKYCKYVNPFHKCCRNGGKPPGTPPPPVTTPPPTPHPPSPSPNPPTPPPPEPPMTPAPPGPPEQTECQQIGSDKTKCLERNICDYDCSEQTCKDKGSFTPETGCQTSCRDVCGCRRDTSCGYNVNSEQCSKVENLCDSVDFGKRGECLRRGGWYSYGGHFCRNERRRRENLENCQVEETVLAVNFGSVERARRVKSSLGILFLNQSEGRYSDENGGIWDFHDMRNMLYGAAQEDENLYKTSFWGKTEQSHLGTRGCIQYIIPICSDGKYELNLKTVDDRYNKSGIRAFNIFFNEMRIAAELDLIALSGQQNLAIDLYIKFDVMGDGQLLDIQGYSETAFIDGEVPLRFCYGECEHQDRNFHMSAMSVVRFAEPSDVTDEDDDCFRYRHDACACRAQTKNRCEYNSETGDCRRRQVCRACMLKSRPRCRRRNVFYSLGGALCENRLNAGNCQIAQTVMAVNLGGDRITFGGIDYAADRDVQFEDPENTKLAGESEECSGMSNNEKELYCTYAYGKSWAYNDNTCITYTVPLPNVGGWYELNLKLAEFNRSSGSDENRGGFNVKVNNKVIIEELDILQYVDKGDTMDVTILFELGGQENEYIWMKGYGTIDVFNFGFNMKIGFCYSNCFVGINGVYKVSAFSVVRLAA